MSEQTEITFKGGKIFESICAIKATVDVVGKSKTFSGGSFSYNYRGIEDLINALSPLLANYQVFIMPTVLETVRNHSEMEKGKDKFITMLKVSYRFYAVDGSFVECTVVGEGIDNGDKSSSKAMSAAYKKALEQVFAIPTVDINDSDAQRPQAQTKPNYPQQNQSQSQKQNQQQRQHSKPGTPEFNPVATSLDDQATPRQLGAIQAGARALNVDAEDECHDLFGIPLKDLSRKGASWMIDHFRSPGRIN